MSLNPTRDSVLQKDGHGAKREHTMQRVSVKRSSVLLGVAVLVGSVVRFLHLGARSFWLDEAVSLAIARLDWRNLLLVLGGREVNMSLYYVLLHLWIGLGQSEFTLRALSAIFGTLTILAVYFLAAEWLGTRVGVAAAFLTALNPALVAYSQEGRAYSLAVLLAIVSSLLFGRCVRSEKRGNWIAYAVTTACGMYAHLFFGWLVVVHCLFLICFRSKVASWRRVVESYGLLGILLLPLSRSALTSTGDQLSWVLAPASTDFFRFFTDSAGAGGALLAVLYILFAVVGLLARARRDETNLRGGRLLLALWWLLPVVATLALSFRFPIFVPRYLLICVPPMLILAATGGCAGYSERRTWLALGIVTAVSVYGINIYQRSTIDPAQSNDWRDAAAYMSRILRDGDALLFYYGGERLPFDIYFRQYHLPAHFTIYPETSTSDLLSGKGAPIDDDLLHELANRHQRIFILSEFQPNERSKHVMQGLAPQCSRQAESKYFGFVRVDQLNCSAIPDSKP
jgi:mannosyltransferase